LERYTSCGMIADQDNPLLPVFEMT
jgi:hypothetical protein